jgi:serine/threonine-protein kinase
MPPNSDLDTRIKQMLSTTLAPHARSMEERPDSTIKPEVKSLGSADRSALELLLRLGAGDEAVLKRKLRLEETIGEGGMGLVHLATQRTIGRKVAVKTLRPEHHNEESAFKLLREGWIIGRLEHPNVIPVHDIGLDAKGMPLIVLKRIEGVDWSELMGDAPRVQEQYGAADLLEWNLGILMQVCNAVSYAHSRGIVHRDLKPENVMIGEFGEVYLVDWGIAVSLLDDSTGRLPLARDCEPAGTPVYMAPELLYGDPATERTDVYLLGAILYEVITGNPPHQCERLRDLVRLVLTSRPPLPDGVPTELGQIVLEAMEPGQEERIASADLFRQRLSGYLQHRGSVQLAEHAERSLTELVETLAAQAEDEEARRLQLYTLFSESRFGFREALETWPDNAAAADGLRRASEVMVGYELEQDDPRAAEALLAGLDQPDPKLRERVQAARRASDEKQRETEAMAHLGRQLDPRVRPKQLVPAIVIFVLWCLGPMLAQLASILGPIKETYLNLTLAESMLLLGALGVGGLARKTLLQTAINRRYVALVGFMIVATILLNVVNAGMGVSVDTGIRLKLFIWFCMAGTASVMVERRFFPTTLGYLAGVGLSIHWPWARYFIITGCHVVLAINAAVIWWPRRTGSRPEEVGEGEG